MQIPFDQQLTLVDIIELNEVKILANSQKELSCYSEKKMVKQKAAKAKISKPKGRSTLRTRTKNCTANLSVDVTLPDGNFLDSFDKFIAGEKQ